jgi:hypothetical protein
MLTAAQKAGEATRQGYNDGVLTYVTSVNPVPLLAVVAGVLVLIFVLIARQRL